MPLIKSKVILIILYTLGLSLLLGLSLWQYQRGMEKQDVNALRAEEGVIALPVTPTSWEAHNYRVRQLTGKWLEDRSLLLENKIFQGRSGYEVLTPFLLADHSAPILVNRGWVGDATQVKADNASKDTRITGIVYLPEPGLELGESILPEVKASNEWPKKSLYIDLPEYENILGTPIQEAILVLDETDPAAFTKIWKAVVMPPAKHFGYAIQWFGLALVLAIYGFIWVKRK